MQGGAIALIVVLAVLGGIAVIALVSKKFIYVVYAVISASKAQGAGNIATGTQ